MTTQGNALARLRRAIGSGWVRISSVSWRKTSIVMVIEIGARRGGRTLETWSIVCKGTREYKITDVDGGGLAVYDAEHPVVRQYLDEVVSLRVVGNLKRTAAVLGDLLEAHRQTVDDWIPFDAYMHPFRLGGSAEAGNAKLAIGPRFLLSAYATTLRVHGVKTRLISEGKRSSGPLVGLHLGDSYVVAESLRGKKC